MRNVRTVVRLRLDEASQSAGLVRASPEEIASLPAGAEVGVVRQVSEDSRQFIVGTVLQSGPEGIALTNCQCRTQQVSGTPLLKKVPYIKRYFKNTGTGKELIPVLWVPSAGIESTLITKPVPADYVAPQVDIDFSQGIFEDQIGIDYDFSIEDARG